MGDKVLKMGVIGVGLQGESHVEKFSYFQNSEVVAIADISKERLKKVANKYKIPHSFTDYRKLLEVDGEGEIAEVSKRIVSAPGGGLANIGKMAAR